VTPIKFLYCAVVMYILEYGTVVWDPDTSCDIMNQIERVQCKFLNFIAYKLKMYRLPQDNSLILH